MCVCVISVSDVSSFSVVFPIPKSTVSVCVAHTYTQCTLSFTCCLFLHVQKSRAYKEVVEIPRNGSPRFTSRTAANSTRAPAPLSDGHTHHPPQQKQPLEDWRAQTKITKFRRTMWGVFVVTADFDPSDENEIQVRRGEHVSVWNCDDQEWFWVVKHASSGSEEGFVPSGCLREVSAESKTPASIRCEQFSVLEFYWHVQYVIWM